MTLRARPRVELDLADRGQLRECFFHHGDFSGLFVPGHVHLEPGVEVDVTVRIAEPDRTFHLRGAVRWTRRKRSGELPAGIGVAFLPGELRTRDLLLDFAKGRSIKMVKRQQSRLPVAIDVDYETDSALLSDVTDDLSEAGAFIASEEPVAVGTVVSLKLRPPNRRFAIKIDAVVTWVQKGGRPGFGVRFQFKSERARRKVEEAVAQLRAQIDRELGLGR